jgi:hypothetical protein
MNDLRPQLVGQWLHSFEEDEGDIRVYRPESFAFPRARGRPGIEFRPNGEFVDLSVGPADANLPALGSWDLEGPGQIAIRFDEPARSAQRLDVVELQPGLLKLRDRSDAG